MAGFSFLALCRMMETIRRIMLRQSALHGRYVAREQLLEILKRDRAFQEDIGRKTMLQVFNLLGGEGELVSKYRKLLASALN